MGNSWAERLHINRNKIEFFNFISIELQYPKPCPIDNMRPFTSKDMTTVFQSKDSDK